MNDNQRRAFFYGMGGLYVIYLAVKMATDEAAAAGMEPGILIGTIVFFAVAGAALLIFAIKIAKKDKEDKDE